MRNRERRTRASRGTLFHRGLRPAQHSRVSSSSNVCTKPQVEAAATAIKQLVLNKVCPAFFDRGVFVIRFMLVMFYPDPALI